MCLLVAEAEALISKLGEAVVTFYKIGYQLGFAGGLVAGGGGLGPERQAGVSST